MLKEVRSAMGGKADRTVLFGSSLGGLVAARAAEADRRVAALVLLAPALRLPDVFRRQLGAAGWKDWRDSGWLAVRDYARKRPGRVDFGFMREAAAVEKDLGPWPAARVPTLVIHGRADETVPVGLSRRWARGRPGVKLVEVPDGHELKASLPRIMAEADAFLAPFLPGRPPHFVKFE